MERLHFVLLAFGVASFVSLSMAVRVRRTQRARTGRTTGVVIGHAPNPNPWVGNRSATAHAVIRYEVDGQTHECVSTVGASWIMHDVGETVDVRFNPTRPSNGDIVSNASDGILTAAIVALPAVGVASLATVAWHLMG